MTQHHAVSDLQRYGFLQIPPNKEINNETCGSCMRVCDKLDARTRTCWLLITFIVFDFQPTENSKNDILTVLRCLYIF